MQKLAGSGKKIIIRVPVIPGINDSDENFSALQSYLGRMKPAVMEISLRPFHTAAENKYKRFGRENFMKNVKSTPREALDERKKELEAIGFIVKIGG
jgi:pyruvate formate lyase activating enzyme